MAVTVTFAPFTVPLAACPTVMPGRAHYLCDTEAERPVTNLVEGDTSYSKDTDKNWCWTGVIWVSLGGLGLGVAWGDITGTLSNQTDLNSALAGKASTTHATTHKSGGTDTIKLDELAAPTDITTLDATTSAHGLMKKYPGGTTTFLRADGSFAAPPGGAGSSATRVVVTAAFPAKINQRINVVDAAIASTHKINAWVSGIANGAANAGDLVDLYSIRAIANTGSFDLDLDFTTPWAGSLSIDYVAFS